MTNPKVDEFLSKITNWKAELTLLRSIILDSNLTEELKWGKPCYTVDGNNIILIHDFKNYCAILFMNGVLLQDKDHLLVQQTENVQAARQMRFTSTKEITALAPTIKAYVLEAIALKKAGVVIPPKKDTAYVIPSELHTKFEETPNLKDAFEALTPGRQHGYLLYFSAAKQAKTRKARIEKYSTRILEGKGLND